MSQNPIVEETKRKLNDLEQRLRAARASPGAHAEIAAEVRNDWENMIRTHADISRRLDASANPSAEVLEGIHLDIDVLRHSFERWMSRVEGGFAQNRDGKSGT